MLAVPLMAQDHGFGPAWESSARALERRGISSSPEGVRAFLDDASKRPSSLGLSEFGAVEAAVLVVHFRRDPGNCESLWQFATKAKAQLLRFRAATALRSLGDAERARVALLADIPAAEKKAREARTDYSRRNAEQTVTDLALEIVRCGDGTLLERLLAQYLDRDHTVSVRARWALREIAVWRTLPSQQLQPLVDPVAEILERRPEADDVYLAGILVHLGVAEHERFRELIAPLANASDWNLRREAKTYVDRGHSLLPIERLSPAPVPVCGGGQP
jgi:hypothetical protein